MRTLLVALLLTAFSTPSRAEDWPQFRGPGGQGISTSKKLPDKWSLTDNLAWKTTLPGAGCSSPIVVGEHVFLTCYSGYNVPGKPMGEMSQLKLHLVCLKRSNGDILWNREIEPKLPEQAKVRDGHGYASHTPVSDGERVYAFFGKSGAVAYDLTGKPLWRKELGSELNGFGSGASPILHGDLLIVNASVESNSIYGLDKKTGDEKWRVRGINEAYNTPTLVMNKDGTSELIVGMPKKIAAFDPKTGQELWTCGNDITWYIVPSVVTHEGVAWSLGGRSGTTAASVKLGGRGDVTKSHRIWTNTKGCNVCSPIYSEGYLYWLSDNEMAVCADAKTGNIVYEERVSRIGQVWASPILADGKIYFLNRSGDTHVIAAKPKYEYLGVNSLRDRSVFNASAAVAGDRMYIRSDTTLYCVSGK